MPINIKMHAFQVYQDEIANLQLPLTKLETLPSVDPKKVDSLLCVGNFNALAVIRDGKVRESKIKTNQVFGSNFSEERLTMVVCMVAQTAKLHTKHRQFSDTFLPFLGAL